MLSRYRFIAFFALICLVFAALAHRAQAAQEGQSSGCDPKIEACVPIGKWDISVSLGYLDMTNPTVKNIDLVKNILPGVSYFGERFYWVNDVMGYSLFESGKHVINGMATIGYDQLYFTDWGVGNFYFGIDPDERSGLVLDSPIPENQGSSDFLDIDLDRLHKRDTALLAGLEYFYQLSPDMDLSVQFLHDISSVYHGSHIRSSASKLFVWDKNSLTMDVGIEWRSARTNDYFYGIRRDEVDDERLAYSVGNDFLYSLKLDWRHKISKHWELRAVWHNRWFGDNTYDSPLVKERRAASTFVGGVYHF